MERKIRRERGDRWCELQIKLENGRLSVCGSEGAILGAARAKKDALEYWVSYFRDEPDAIHEMNKRCGKHFRSPLSAARFVVASDGDFHGLDVHAEDGGKVYTTESCGQIRETLSDWFPEARPLFAWHLNNMKAGCEHQDKLGWGHGHTVALSPNDLTDAQREALNRRAEAKTKPARDRLVKEREDRQRAEKVRKDGRGFLVRSELATIRADVEREIKPAPFEGAIYKDSIGAPCPTCGYEYGTAWLKRELPEKITELAEMVCGE